MKPTGLSIIILLFISVSAFPQSKSFYTLKETFSGSKDVYSFHASGFLARTALWIAGEHEFTNAIKEVKDIYVIVIPKEAFETQQVTLHGFRKLTSNDSFEELAHVRDHGDDITLLIQGGKKDKNNRYLILIDSDQDIVVVEVKGFIDPGLLLNKKENIALAN